MGNSLESIEKTRQSTDDLEKQILKDGAKLVSDFNLIGWNNRTCENLKLVYRDKLMQFDTDILRKTGLRLALDDTGRDESSIVLNKRKQEFCSQIVNYYNRKIAISKDIQGPVHDNIRRHEETIFKNFASMIVDLPLDQQKEALARLDKLEGLINRFYMRLNDNFKLLVSDITPTELDRLEKDTYSLLGKGYLDICNAVTDLRDFYWIEVNSNGIPYYYNPYLGNSSATYQIPKLNRLSPVVKDNSSCVRYSNDLLPPEYRKTIPPNK